MLRGACDVHDVHDVRCLVSVMRKICALPAFGVGEEGEGIEKLDIILSRAWVITQEVYITVLR